MAVPHEVIAGKVEERLGKEVEDRVGRQGTEVADHAGGGEAVLGGQHGVEVRQAAPLRRSGRSGKTVMAVKSGWLTLVGGIGPVPLLTRAAARPPGGS